VGDDLEISDVEILRFLPIWLSEHWQLFGVFEIEQITKFQNREIRNFQFGSPRIGNYSEWFEIEQISKSLNLKIRNFQFGSPRIGNYSECLKLNKSQNSKIAKSEISSLALQLPYQSIA
jgi:hypothetical protein